MRLSLRSAGGHVPLIGAPRAASTDPKKGDERMNIKKADEAAPVCSIVKLG
jgi:hypothetical protein